jgi:hypothetical protein
MKKYLAQAVIFCGILVLATSAWSLTINSGSTDVGSLDELLYEANMATVGSSGDAAVKAWVESQLGFSVSLEGTNNALGPWYEVDSNAGYYAHQLSFNPEYFLLKTGNVTNDGNQFFLFKNNNELSWAVISLIEMGFTSFTNISGVSHITEYNAQVPEAGTAILLGSGLLMLVGYGRRMRKK